MLPFGAVTFLGAFLLFLVQPLLARRILPWFGGAQAVWATCLVFYQAMLFAGYLYAHLGRRLGLRRQALLHGALLIASLALLPIAPSPAWKPDGVSPPLPVLLGLLLVTVGGPYLLLAGTAPLLQDWIARSRPLGSPLRLYAVSNAGSLLALAAYPLILEPALGVADQTTIWSATYAAFALACGGLALRVARLSRADAARVDGAVSGAPATGVGAPAPRADAAPPSRADLALWCALAGCGSGLLLAVTNHVTMDVAAAPFLWLVPLVAYLATYILAFAGLYRRATWGALLVLAMGAMAILWSYGFALPLGVQVAGGVGALFAACMVCHGELARSAPPAERLTAFYLCIAAGGALGGTTVALVAPLVLDDFWELPGFLLGAFALLGFVLHRERGGSGRRWTPSDFAMAGVAALVAAAFAFPAAARNRGTVEVARDFYGVLRVQERPEGIFHEQRVLRVGRIVHGGQFLDPARARRPTAYFTEGSGVEVAIRRHPKRIAAHPLRIGVIGLGVGSVAAWGAPGDSIRYYELDPEVERIARRWFTYLTDTPAEVTVVPGDGRLSIERERDAGAGRRFDVLVIDAFAGDAVPVHLLTRESADVFWGALADDGVLVYQVTNRHLDLAPVVRGLARERGVTPIRVAWDPPEGSGGSPSVWMLLSRNADFLARARPADTPDGSDRAILWTDDHSDLLGVLR